MTDEELAAIKRRMDTPHFYAGSVPTEIEDELTQDARDIGALLAAVENLRVIEAQYRQWLDGMLKEQTEYSQRNAALAAENTALREIAQAVADMPNILTTGSYPFCVACQRYADDHAPDCAKAKARVLLGDSDGAQ